MVPVTTLQISGVYWHKVYHERTNVDTKTMQVTQHPMLPTNAVILRLVTDLQHRFGLGIDPVFFFLKGLPVALSGYAV